MLYLLIAPYTNEKVDLLHIVELMYAREMDTEAEISRYVRKLLTYELMPVNQEEEQAKMAAYEPFHSATKNHQTHMTEFFRQLI